jgi:hypothetical protein
MFNEKDAELINLIPEEEKRFSVEATCCPENAEEAIQKSCACYFSLGAGLFSSIGRFTAKLGAVEPTEIKLIKYSLTFRPFWRAKGAYACRYKRIHVHKLEIEDDVEAVTIYGNDQYVVSEKKRLSDLLAGIGADVGINYGPLKVSLGPLEGSLRSGISSVLGSKDREIKRRVELEIKDIVEIAAFSYAGAFLFDPNLNLENQDLYNLLSTRDLNPIQKNKLKQEFLQPAFSRSQVIEQVKEKLYKKPEEQPHQILEQVFKISEVSLIYIPFYDIELKYRDKGKKVRLNGISGKTIPLN